MDPRGDAKWRRNCRVTLSPSTDVRKHLDHAYLNVSDEIKMTRKVQEEEASEGVFNCSPPTVLARDNTDGCFTAIHINNYTCLRQK